MVRIKTIIITFLFSQVFSAASFAQEAPAKGVIVLSPSELESVLEKIAFARRINLEREKQKEALLINSLSAAQKQTVASKAPYLSSTPTVQQHSTITAYDVSQQQMALLEKKIEMLNARLDEQRNIILLQLDKNSENANSTVNIVTPTSHAFHQTTAENKGSTSFIPTDSTINELDKKLALLMQIIQKKDNTPSQATFSQQENHKKEIGILQNQVASLQKELLAIQSAPKEKTTQNIIESIKIFFDNNTTTINTEGLNLLKDLVKKSNSINNLIMVRGFASNTGSASYNQKISSQRANAVKNALYSLGIPKDRVITIQQGIDYNNDANYARRAEVSILSTK